MLGTTFGILLQLSAAVQPGPDAERVARSAQERFELIRRMNLPRTFGGGGGQRCDATVGRFCYWYDGSDTSVAPEPRRIAEARSVLIAALDSAAALAPRSGWIAGQRVRYLIEGGRSKKALAAAHACAGEGWFCSALAGLALHAASDYAAADSAFAAALDRMPQARRCEWHNVAVLANAAIAREMERASCAEREQLAAGYWTLGQPLWLTRGNDLRTEHFARHTMILILQDAAGVRGMTWAADNREMVLRYGWPEWYTRVEPSVYQIAAGGITGHDREPSYAFYPDVPSLRGTPRLTSASWRFREPAARTRYAPAHLRKIGALEHQFARMPRGDSMLVAVAYRVTDMLLSRDSSRVAAFSSRPSALGQTGSRLSALDSGRSADRRSADRLSALGSLTMMVPRDTMIASIEVYGAESRRAELARYTVDPLACRRWCLSDLLLFNPRDSVDERELERAAHDAATANVFSAKDPIGVYWEVEGGASQPVWLHLTVTPTRISAARRLATRLKLAPELSAVRLHWQTTLAEGGGPNGRSVALRVPLTARGRYRLTLSVEPPGEAPISSSRDIEIIP